MGPVGLVLVAVLLAVTVGLPLHDLIRDRAIRTMAARNASRRPREALLVVLGSMLGTAIIVSTFVVGDTVGASVRDIAARQQGPIDEVVEVSGVDRGDELLEALGDTPPGVDGLAARVAARGVVGVPGPDGAVEPQVWLSEMEFADARGLGADPTVTGFVDAGETPRSGEVVINEALADDLEGVEAGDRLEVTLYRQTLDLTVRDVIDEVGVAGSSDMFLAPGTIGEVYGELLADGGDPLVEEPVSQLLVSNDGGVFDGVDGSEAVTDALNEALVGVEGLSIDEVKVDVLDSAEDAAANFTSIFRLIGSFSVLAGIALLVNLFVMLAEERRTELGMLRAVGLRRIPLVRLFAAEGFFYSLAACLVGALVGVIVGWAIVGATANLLAAELPDLHLVLDVEPAKVVVGALVGLLISMVTVLITSVRIARLNVISAIRQLPNPRKAKRSIRSVVAGCLGVGVGLLMFSSGLGDPPQPMALLMGLPIAALCAIPVASRLLPAKVARVSLSMVAIAWSLLVFRIFADEMEGAAEGVFVAQGILMVVPSVAILASADRIWAGLADLLSATGRGLSARLGLAYPLARTFRTSLIVFTFSIVVFVLSLLTVMTAYFGQIADDIAAGSSAGYDLVVGVNSANPPTRADLEGVDGVAEVAPLHAVVARFSTEDEPEPKDWTATVVDPLVAHGQLELSDRLDDYADDAAVFDAVLASSPDEPVVVVSEDFLVEEGGPGAAVSRPGDEVTIVDRTTGEEVVATVAGTYEADFFRNGMWVSEAFVDEMLPGQEVLTTYYVEVASDVAAATVADRLNRELVSSGVDARTFDEEIDEFLSRQNGFLALLQGYLGLGLLIGIAGLGVVMVRAVRERRREIGMLRAMGYSERLVRSAFVFEATFITFQGVVLGAVLGAVSAVNFIGGSEVFGSAGASVEIPWSGFAIIAAWTLGFSLLATIVPAIQASRTRPAVALRIAE